MSHADNRWAELRGETFLIIGFTERTGRSAAELFDAHAVRYRVSDCRPMTALEPQLAGLRVGPERVHAGPQRPDQLDGITQILLSPGVPRAIPMVEEAVRRKITIWSDIDLAYDLIGDRTIVAITGTDGKTTTALLTAAILESGRSVVAAGNMGVPILAKLDEIHHCSTVVLELSSFMLEQLHRFRPNVSTVLNLAVDHVERYPNRQGYRRAKLGVVQHCTGEDLFVRNLDDPILATFVPGRARVATVSAAGAVADAAWVEGWLTVDGERMRYQDCRLRGRHNASNALTAVTIGRELGIPVRTALEVVRDFQPLPHRFEHLGRHGEVLVVDDSKATTVHAVAAALASLDSPVVLIVGGQDKGLPFAELRAHQRKLRWVVCYGEAAERIHDELGLTASEIVGPFDAAVQAAVDRTRPGDTLLLSPGCTSWDQFPSYEVRGHTFRELAIARLRNRATVTRRSGPGR